MNKAYINQTGGLRLDTDLLEFGLEAPKIAQYLGYLAHDLAIISGCDVSGNVVRSGVVFINGEILPFKQSQLGNTVVIVEQKTKRTFKTGASKDVLFDRWVEFGVSTQSYNWASFYRVKSLKELEENVNKKADLETFNNLVTRVAALEVFARPFASGGTMLFWNKPADQIPEGWREATNWRGRMPMGWNPDDPDFATLGQEDGQKMVSITKNHLPAVGVGYKDAYYIESDGVTGNVISGKIPLGANYAGSNASDNNNNTLHYRNATTDNLGNGQALGILPPHRIVLFIEPII